MRYLPDLEFLNGLPVEKEDVFSKDSFKSDDHHEEDLGVEKIPEAENEEESSRDDKISDGDEEEEDDDDIDRAESSHKML